jgi:23S rRNA (guanine745-N1)-methyltransferase
MLVCPICELVLTRDGPRYHCPNAHSFDIARDGYVNLLRVPYPGDTRAMLHARRAFLDAGHYRPLAVAIAAHIHAHIHANTATPAVLDIGCGEGTYVATVAGALNAAKIPATCFGLDVAKDAVSLAAKRHPNVQFLVANTRARLPFAAFSLGALLCVFAPRNPPEFARVLTPGGLFLVAMPSPQHLREARAAFGLLDVEPEKERHIQAQFAGDFTLAGIEPIDYTLTLTGPDLANLILMSPSARHVAPAQLDRARNADQFTVTVSFVVQRYLRRTSPPSYLQHERMSQT